MKINWTVLVFLKDNFKGNTKNKKPDHKKTKLPKNYLFKKLKAILAYYVQILAFIAIFSPSY